MELNLKWKQDSILNFLTLETMKFLGSTKSKNN